MTSSSPPPPAALLEGGWTIEPEDLARISPYLTEHINRFGEYSTHELSIQPEAYDPKPDVDFTPLREADPAAAGFGQAGFGQAGFGQAGFGQAGFGQAA